MDFIAVTEDHFAGISALVPTPDALYRIHPSATFPLDSAQLLELMKARHDLTVLVDDGQIIGFANLYNVKANQSAFIGNVVVSSSHRGLGLGKALIVYMSRLCSDKYNAEAHLSVFNFNTTAILLYTKLGFKPYAIEERLGLDKQSIALLHMCLDHASNEKIRRTSA